MVVGRGSSAWMNTNVTRSCFCFGANSPSDSSRCIAEHHAPLLLPDTLAGAAQKQKNQHRGDRDTSLSTESHRRPRFRHPFDLNIRRHEAGPVPAGRSPKHHFAGSLGVAVEQVGVDGCSHDHDADALHATEDGEDHVVPAMLKSEA